MFTEFFQSEQLVILTQIIFIDLVLAGDNAIIIGMVASKFPLEQRKKVIFWGIGGAIIGLRSGTAQPLGLQYLLLAATVAAFIGGVSILGGKGGVVGAFVGTLTVNFLNTGLVFNVTPAYIAQMYLGGLLLVVILFQNMSKVYEDKPASYFVHQYYHSKKFKSRRTALEKAMRLHCSNPSALLSDALSDSFWNIRVLASELAARYGLLEVKSDLQDKIISLIDKEAVFAVDGGVYTFIAQ